MRTALRARANEASPDSDSSPTIQSRVKFFCLKTRNLLVLRIGVCVRISYRGAPPADRAFTPHATMEGRLVCAGLEAQDSYEAG